MDYRKKKKPRQELRSEVAEFDWGDYEEAETLYHWPYFEYENDEFGFEYFVDRYISLLEYNRWCTNNTYDFLHLGVCSVEEVNEESVKVRVNLMGFIEEKIYE